MGAQVGLVAQGLRMAPASHGKWHARTCHYGQMHSRARHYGLWHACVCHYRQLCTLQTLMLAVGGDAGTQAGVIPRYGNLNPHVCSLVPDRAEDAQRLLSPAPLLKFCKSSHAGELQLTFLPESSRPTESNTAASVENSGCRYREKATSPQHSLMWLCTCTLYLRARPASAAYRQAGSWRLFREHAAATCDAHCCVVTC